MRLVCRHALTNAKSVGRSGHFGWAGSRGWRGGTSDRWLDDDFWWRNVAKLWLSSEDTIGKHHTTLTISIHAMESYTELANTTLYNISEFWRTSALYNEAKHIRRHRMCDDMTRCYAHMCVCVETEIRRQDRPTGRACDCMGWWWMFAEVYAIEPRSARWIDDRDRLSQVDRWPNWRKTIIRR